MYYVGTLLFSSPLGWLSDTIGRKPVMVGGAIVYTVALLLFTTTTDPYWFILFRLLEGIGTAAFGPAAQAFVADITTAENRSRAYGFLTTAQFGGLIVGPALAAPLYALGGRRHLRLLCDLLLRRGAQRVRAGRARALRPGPGGAQGAARATPPRGRAPAASESAPHGRPYRLIFTAPIIAFVVIAFTSHFAHGRVGRGVESLPQRPGRVQDVHQHDLGGVQRPDAAQLPRWHAGRPLEPLLAVRDRLRALGVRVDLLPASRPT